MTKFVELAIFLLRKMLNRENQAIHARHALSHGPGPQHEDLAQIVQEGRREGARDEMPYLPAIAESNVSVQASLEFAEGWAQAGESSLHVRLGANLASFQSALSLASNMQLSTALSASSDTFTHRLHSLQSSMEERPVVLSVDHDDYSILPALQHSLLRSTRETMNDVETPTDYMHTTEINESQHRNRGSNPEGGDSRITTGAGNSTNELSREQGFPQRGTREPRRRDRRLSRRHSFSEWLVASTCCIYYSRTRRRWMPTPFLIFCIRTLRNLDRTTCFSILIFSFAASYMITWISIANPAYFDDDQDHGPGIYGQLYVWYMCLRDDTGRIRC